ncbi:MAG: histidinol dehydrogenase [Sporolactobacillus sp.]|jgi:histidinol dehydrogenase/sulfopropanediol 3-dehydrogenase|nr:histidinol dehydrogenase [Sporolactobacillus sp.]MCI1882848.1 histidinol dehydrogenase [Sporolactobacillus sp.]
MKFIKQAVKKTYQKDQHLTDTVSAIINNVKKNGDQEIKKLSSEFDHVDLDHLRISRAEILQAYREVDDQTIEDLRFAAGNITYFAQNQLHCLKEMTIESPIAGVSLGHKLIPIQRTGSYVPGGRYPLPSSALMSIIPAKVAGVSSVIACCPPSRRYKAIHPAVLVAMDLAGADEIYCVGGAQAIAAMAYGTESIKKTNLIVGPGNRFVTEAKRQVLGDVGIDGLAGPSEVLVLADETANPSFVAIDLLAQAEHDPNTKCILVSTDNGLIKAVEDRIASLFETLETNEICKKSWENNGQIILAEDKGEMIRLSDEIAPEHLEIQTEDADALSQKVTNFGSMFIGPYSPVAFGDYVSGTNHILPTMETAKFANGLWVGTFLKTAFLQKITEEGCKHLAPACTRLAEVEGLLAHKKSVEMRTAAVKEN